MKDAIIHVGEVVSRNVVVVVLEKVLKNAMNVRVVVVPDVVSHVLAHVTLLVKKAVAMAAKEIAKEIARVVAKTHAAGVVKTHVPEMPNNRNQNPIEKKNVKGYHYEKDYLWSKHHYLTDVKCV